MTREEHLKYCEICKNQKFSMNHGVMCRLTNRIADFEGSCDYFDEDTNLTKRLKRSNNSRQEKRLANFFLDLIFIFIINFILVIFLVFFNPRLLIFLADNEYYSYLFSFIVLILYYIIFESLTGRTIAKYITKTKVVNENGNKPDLVSIILRTLYRFIPFEAFSYMDTDNLGWHDRFSKTKVIEI